jgi:hypothetical protein
VDQATDGALAPAVFALQLAESGTGRKIEPLARAESILSIHDRPHVERRRAT